MHVKFWALNPFSTAFTWQLRAGKKCAATRFTEIHFVLCFFVGESEIIEIKFFVRNHRKQSRHLVQKQQHNVLRNAHQWHHFWWEANHEEWAVEETSNVKAQLDCLKVFSLRLFWLKKFCDIFDSKKTAIEVSFKELKRLPHQKWPQQPEHENLTNIGTRYSCRDSYQSNSLAVDVLLISDLECFALFVRQFLWKLNSQKCFAMLIVRDGFVQFVRRINVFDRRERFIVSEYSLSRKERRKLVWQRKLLK